MLGLFDESAEGGLLPRHTLHHHCCGAVLWPRFPQVVEHEGVSSIMNAQQPRAVVVGRAAGLQRLLITSQITTG